MTVLVHAAADAVPAAASGSHAASFRISDNFAACRPCHQCDCCLGRAGMASRGLLLCKPTGLAPEIWGTPAFPRLEPFAWRGLPAVAAGPLPHITVLDSRRQWQLGVDQLTLHVVHRAHHASRHHGRCAGDGAAADGAREPGLRAAA
jgi:hypothetical protein